MEPGYFDNRARIVKDDLVASIANGDRVAIASSVFSMYAYQELAEQLEGIEELRFIFTSQAFTKQRPPREKREFYIPRLAREQGLCGTEFEIKLRNELTQKAVALECADWIRRKARFRSFEGGERKFAEDMDAAAEVAVYAKLPRTFQIPTPVGNYAPDWAIAFKEGSVRHIFFIAETKGTMDTMGLSGVENAKIACAKKLFNEMSAGDVRYHNVATYEDLLEVMGKMD